MTRRAIVLGMVLATVTALWAQSADYTKMSGFVRQALVDHRTQMRRAPHNDGRLLCALVKTDSPDTRPLTVSDCEVLCSFGSLHVVSVPLARLAGLSANPHVLRIEAGAPHEVTMDTATIAVNAVNAHQGRAMPQAFTGKGVVVGVQDIGFDLTHPNFYNADLNEYRIKCFWDQLADDSTANRLFVGAEYRTPEAVLAYQHSRDGLIQTHGTHTLGSAAGSGYDTPYRGIAYDSDICIVSNAVSSDLVLIDSADVYKYTYATDVLGFKYMFDYAGSRGMPCVVSFSEGSHMDFRGDDVLFYEAIDSIVGPGRILVASAGNDGYLVNYMRKPASLPLAGATIFSGNSTGGLTFKANDRFDVVLKFYDSAGNHKDYTLSPDKVLACQDSLLTDTVTYDSMPYYITATAYPSCFDGSEMVLELYIRTVGMLGMTRRLKVDISGNDTDVECYRVTGYITPDDDSLGSNAYSIHSPASAPSAICVGATGYRTAFRNYLGDWVTYDKGTDGIISDYSSVGPTLDGRIKPDVVAPGTNVISSYSSFYLENNPDANDIKADVTHFDFGGRTYAWNCNSGTSMSTPVVAGCIALWLQAKPDLTPDEVMGLIERTSRRYDTTVDYPNNIYGYGQIDVYRGLLDILGISSVAGVSRHMPQSVSFALSADGTLDIGFGRELGHAASVRVFTTAGTTVLSHAVPAGHDSVSLQLGSLPKGIYAVQVDGADAGITGSTLIRL